MRVTRTDSVVRDDEWDAFVAEIPGGSHVQTTRWARAKAVLGWEASLVRIHRGEELVGGCLLLERGAGPARVAYGPRGPLATDDAALEAAVEGVLRGRHVYVKVQPPPELPAADALLRSRGFAPSEMEAGPTATVRVDLSHSEEEVMRRMRASARTNVKRARKRGVVIKSGTPSELPAFGELLRQTGERQGFAPYPAGYYEAMYDAFAETGDAQVLLAEHEGRPLSAMIIVAANDTAAYKMGAWDGQRSNIRPNELCHLTAMAWARERGYRWYDFDGIPGDVARAIVAGAEPEQHGTTWFKLGLGGEITLYPGAYDSSGVRMLRPAVRLAAPRMQTVRGLAHRVLGRQA